MIPTEVGKIIINDILNYCVPNSSHAFIHAYINTTKMLHNN